MSENIQSISQGTYTIGQTSANDSSLLVTENSGNVSILQGTVATSAGIVGDGTTQNPLRADETVLWSGTGNISTFTLSEKLSNFERFRMVFQGYNTPQSGFCEDYSPPDGSNISYMYQHYVAGTDTNPLQLWAGRFSSTDNLTYNLVDWKWMCMPGNSNAWSNDWNNNNRKPMIKQIIGINRIANN